MDAYNPDFYALVVGASWYRSPELVDLPETLNDAQSLCDALIDPKLCHYEPDRTHPLLGAGATLEGFRNELQWLARVARATSTVLIYFSGHGGRVELPLDASSGYESYLCFQEADPRRLAETALSANELNLGLRAIHAGRLVVIIDTCFAAGAASFKSAGASAEPETVWRDGLSNEAFARLGAGAGRVVMASSTASQVSYVREQGDKSLFTYYLLEALKGGAGVRRDGYIHILDVFHYVSEAVSKQALRQTPILKADDLDSNFPVAFDQGGERRLTSAAFSRDLSEARERISAEPMAGAQALEDLSERLPDRPEQRVLRNEIERLRDELTETQRHVAARQTGEALVERERLVYLLLNLCVGLEERLRQAPEPQPGDVRAQVGKISITGNTFKDVQIAETINNNYGPGWQVRNKPDPDAD